MNILLFNKYCPECFGSDFEVVNEEFLYCCNCGLEVKNNLFISNKKLFNELELQDYERFEKYLQKKKL